MRRNFKNSAYLKGTIALITKHPQNKYTAAELALAAGVSSSKLQHDFLQLYNQSVYRYTLQFKVEYAIKFIHQKKLAIHKIALLTGFTNTPELIKAFKKHFRQKAPKPKRP